MKTPFFKSLISALRVLNSKYGKGTIIEYGIFADGKIYIVEKGFNMKPSKRKGRIIWKSKFSPFGKATVFLYGKQFTFSIIGE